MARVVPWLFVFAAIVNALPVIGVVSSARLASLYEVTAAGPDLELLLRHRALLFAIVAALLGAAAFHPPLRLVAGLAGLFSMVSFVALAAGIGDVNAPLRRVALVDVVASVVLGVALWIDAAAQS